MTLLLAGFAFKACCCSQESDSKKQDVCRNIAGIDNAGLTDDVGSHAAEIGGDFVLIQPPAIGVVLQQERLDALVCSN